jgi:hypothetical protein
MRGKLSPLVSNAFAAVSEFHQQDGRIGLQIVIVFLDKARHSVSVCLKPISAFRSFG